MSTLRLKIRFVPLNFLWTHLADQAQANADEPKLVIRIRAMPERTPNLPKHFETSHQQKTCQHMRELRRDRPSAV
ncbi:hypothetical protein F2P79_000223 [Pimephales promelas]|nr:hypothetical protein F2P79_000223 [Pimephales promelas]